MKYFILLGLISKPMARPKAPISGMPSSFENGGWGSVKIVGPFETLEDAKLYMNDRNHQGIIFPGEQA